MDLDRPMRIACRTRRRDRGGLGLLPSPAILRFCAADAHLAITHREIPV